MSDMSIIRYLKERFSRVIRGLPDLEKYQEDAFQFVYKNKFSALFMDTGLGKTAVIMRLIYELILRDECHRVLIIGPHRVVNVGWPDELAIWSIGAPITHKIIITDELEKQLATAGKTARDSAKIKGLNEKAVKLIGQDARKKKASILLKQMIADDNSKVYLIHTDGIEFLVDAFGRDWPFDVVIVDESSNFKDHKTNRWKALWKVRPLMKRMHQLTATPASEGYIHLFGQISLLDKGLRLGKDFSQFAETYFTQNHWNRKWAIRPGGLEAITKKIADICLIMKQEDYLDLEQPKTVKHIIHLSEAEARLYKTMENESVIDIGKQGNSYQVEAKNAAELSAKLSQMASGVVYETVLDEQGNGDLKPRRVVHHIHDHKIEMLRKLVAETEGHNLLVSYFHQSSLDRIMKAFPQAKPMDKKGKLIEQWNKGKVPMLLLHPQSNAHGLNLQHGGRHVVFFDLVWSYEYYYQLYRRLARKGQKFLVLIHQFITEKTIDEIQAESLEQKREGQEVMFKWITNLRARINRRKAKMESVFEDDSFDNLEALDELGELEQYQDDEI